MGKDVYEQSPEARAIFQKADEVLGFSLSGLCFNGPEQELLQTVNTQPAILVTSLAYHAAGSDLLKKNARLQPSFMAGHSLGEYTALVAADALDFADAVRLVRERGRLMQHAGTLQEGAMGAVIGFEESLLEAVCKETGAELANLNSDDQIVISGGKEAVAAALKLAEARGAKRVVPLRVSGAFHSSLMAPAVEGMRKALSVVNPRSPRVPVIGNVTAQPLTNPKAIQEELIKQISSPVQWNRTVRYMAAQGVKTFVEIGPGSVLTGLVKRIVPEAEAINVSKAEGLAALRA
ncbi:MAG: ACP S-malonyltransferase [Chloroflexi bacterium]|nr:ACP S-malonyltransferase [Chloroflexota bacterium]